MSTTAVTTPTSTAALQTALTTAVANAASASNTANITANVSATYPVFATYFNNDLYSTTTPPTYIASDAAPSLNLAFSSTANTATSYPFTNPKPTIAQQATVYSSPDCPAITIIGTSYPLPMDTLIYPCQAVTSAGNNYMFLFTKTGINFIDVVNQIIKWQYILPSGVTPIYQFKSSGSLVVINSSGTTVATILNAGSTSGSALLMDNAGGLTYSSVSGNNALFITGSTRTDYLANTPGQVSIPYKITKVTNQSQIMSLYDNKTLINLTSSTWSSKLYTYIQPTIVSNYTFQVSYTSNFRLWINNSLVMDYWNTTLPSTATPATIPYSINMDPAKGPYYVYIETKHTVPAVASIALKYMATGQTTYSDILQSAPSSKTTAALFLQPFAPYSMVYNALLSQSTNYCNALNVKGFPNFTSDTFCTSTANQILNNQQIATYCNGDDTTPANWTTNDIGTLASPASFCTAVDKNIIANLAAKNKAPNTQVPGLNINYKVATPINNGRASYYNSQILKSVSATDNTQGTLTADTIDYITNDLNTVYKQLITSGSAPTQAFQVIENAVNITSKTGQGPIINYCETNATSYPPIKTQLCDAIYNTFPNDPNVASSIFRINDYENCVSNNKFMTDPTGTASEPSCSDKATNPTTFAHYLPLAVDYCATGNNIIKPECQNYYSKVGANITNLAAVAPSPTSSFVGGKESFYNNDDDMCGNDSFMIFFMVFIFMIIISMLMTTCFNKKEYNVHDSTPPSIIVAKAV